MDLAFDVASDGSFLCQWMMQSIADEKLLPTSNQQALVSLSLLAPTSEPKGIAEQERKE